jgi:AraC-like DNA-binding protein/mannose-6-phosphate isomerase-like protein (cupin superfamily)
MAHLYIPDELSDVELQLKAMYLYFSDKGFDLSKPIHFDKLIEIHDQYICETGVDPLFFTDRTKKRHGVLITPEMVKFSNESDVIVNIHLRYCPVPIHAHEYYEIMCVTRGNCTIYIGNNPVSLQTGDTIIMPPYVVHTISVFNDDCVLYNEVIRFSTLQSKFSNILTTKQVVSELFRRSFNDQSDPCYLLFRAGDYYLGDNKFGDIAAEFNNSQEYSFEILNILTSAFLYDLLRKYSDTATITMINDNSAIETLLTKYINDHPETVTLTDLSRRFSYSNRHMSRIIKQRTGLSYSDLVKKVKMENIAKMLVVTDMPINKIMEMSGISSPSYFFKTFKSYFGETPLEYRNSRLSEKANVHS